MPPVGYTQKQAARLLHRLEVQAARVCDELVALHDLVPDHGRTPNDLQELVLERQYDLQAIVNRRRRSQ